MTIRMNSPGCPCCDPCGIPIGGWSTSDDWTINAPDLFTEDSSAIAISVNEHPDSESSHVVTALVTGLNSGDQARLIVAYTDADNYLFGQIEFGNPIGKLRLYKRVSGTNTELIDGVSADFSAAKELTHWLRVCYDADGELLRVTFTNSSGATHSRTYSVAATGTKIGVGTGTVGNTVYFEDVEWSIFSNDCPGCGVACSTCTDGLAPPYVKVVFSGIVKKEPPSGACDCVSLNGTWISQSNGGFPLCQWLSESIGSCGAITASANIGALPDDPGGGAVYHAIVSAQGMTFRKVYGATPNPCAEWDDEALTHFDSSLSVCDGSAATCKITAIGLD